MNTMGTPMPPAENLEESRMRENRTSGLTRGGATAPPTLPVGAIYWSITADSTGAGAHAALALSSAIGLALFAGTAILTTGWKAPRFRWAVARALFRECLPMVRHRFWAHLLQVRHRSARMDPEGRCGRCGHGRLWHGPAHCRADHDGLGHSRHSPLPHPLSHEHRIRGQARPA